MEWIRKEQERLGAALQLLLCILAVVLAVKQEVRVTEKSRRKRWKKEAKQQEKLRDAAFCAKKRRLDAKYRRSWLPM